MTIKQLKKELRITDATIAQWFGYANVQSYRNSSGKPKIEAGLLKVYLFYHRISWESEYGPESPENKYKPPKFY
jgi:hypothetical protein